MEHEVEMEALGEASGSARVTREAERFWTAGLTVFLATEEGFADARARAL